MNKFFILILLLAALFLYSCTSEISFNKGIKKLDGFDREHGATLKAPPNVTSEIDGLTAQLIGYSALNDLNEPLELLIDFKLKLLEAEKLHAIGWQWGRASTTKYGFGCKGYERVINSSKIRNASAQTGFEAVEILQMFIETYPKESTSIGLTQKDVLTLNAAYFLEEEEAKKDSAFMESVCDPNKDK